VDIAGYGIEFGGGEMEGRHSGIRKATLDQGAEAGRGLACQTRIGGEARSFAAAARVAAVTACAAVREDCRAGVGGQQ
jgi:hypothetical protein